MTTKPIPVRSLAPAASIAHILSGIGPQIMLEAQNDAGAAAVAAETTTETTAKVTETAKETGTTATATETGETAKAATETTKAEDDGKAALPDNWRELASDGDEDTLKLLKRYGAMKGVAKALKEAQATIRSGQLKRPKPDGTDEAALAEWRKAEGIPDDPTGYAFPETVKKRMTDDDKPLMSSFTEYAHKKGAPQAVIDVASEWYFDTVEAMEGERKAADASAKEEAEDALRKDWAHGEYKANTTLANRFLASVPGVGDLWSEARLPDGRLLGSLPEFITWASDMGRERFGDVVFANSDSEKRHSDRKTEIEKIRDTDFDRYESENLDKELLAITEKELKRGKR